MPREYKTIQEVAGPLMLVKGVENVKYDELGEIELPNGERRRCKVLEINGTDALVQLFEKTSPSRYLYLVKIHQHFLESNLQNNFLLEKLNNHLLKLL